MVSPTSSGVKERTSVFTHNLKLSACKDWHGEESHGCHGLANFL